MTKETTQHADADDGMGKGEVECTGVNGHGDDDGDSRAVAAKRN